MPFPTITATIKVEAVQNNAKLGLGLAWFVADNVSLEGILSYGATAIKLDGDDSATTHTTTALNLGLQFFIPLKKSN